MRTYVRDPEAHAHVRFPPSDRAARPLAAEDAARELPNLTLEDALQLVRLYAEHGSPKYEKAALCWPSACRDSEGLEYKTENKAETQMHPSMLSAFVPHDPDEFLATRHGLMAFRIEMHLCVSCYPGEQETREVLPQRQGAPRSEGEIRSERALELSEAA